MSNSVKVRQSGNALILTIPVFIIRQLGIKKNEELTVKLIGDQIIYQKS
jgi:antitoxin component of MazEF toxin-antitoxin module